MTPKTELPVRNRRPPHAPSATSSALFSVSFYKQAKNKNKQKSGRGRAGRDRAEAARAEVGAEAGAEVGGRRGRRAEAAPRSAPRPRRDRRSPRRGSAEIGAEAASRQRRGGSAEVAPLEPRRSRLARMRLAGVVRVAVVRRRGRAARPRGTSASGTRHAREKP